MRSALVSLSKAVYTLSLAALLTVASACSSSDSNTTQGSTTSGSGGAGSTSSGGTGNATTGSSTSTGVGGGVQQGLTKVGTGEYETFYLKDGTVYAYGGGSSTLGLGTYEGISVPPKPIATPAGLKFVDVQGGLHQSMAIDENHHAWTWGDVNSGLSGSGMDNIDPHQPYQIVTDKNGAPFEGIVGVAPETAFDSALKSDGTVWVWGDCSGGIIGDGTDGGVVKQPTQVPIPLPSGVTIKKISAANALLALASDGSVWAWGPAEGNVLGTGDTTPGNVPRKVIDLPADIVDISAGGADFFYALSSQGELFGWGYRNAYLGVQNGPFTQPTPLSLTTVLNLQAPVKVVASDSLTTHVILTDGTLWGWGDAACGGVGDGEEPDWTPQGCGWDFMAYDKMVYKPVQIVPAVSNFTQIFSNSAYDFYVYAQTENGDLYSWGRNKTGTLGNGVVPGAMNGNDGTASNVAANHPNSWDVPTATLVTPFTTAPVHALSPCCAQPNDPGCM